MTDANRQTLDRLAVLAIDMHVMTAANDPRFDRIRGALDAVLHDIASARDLDAATACVLAALGTPRRDRPARRGSRATGCG